MRVGRVRAGDAGPDRQPESPPSGANGYATLPRTPGRWPKVSIWQGTADVKVNPANARELVEQWTNVHGIRRAPAKNKVKGDPHAMYKDDDGKVMVETYTITGMKHAVPVNLGSGADHGGVRGTYTPDFKICASYYVSKERCLGVGQDIAMTTHPVDHSIGGGIAPVRSTIKP